MRRQIRSSSIRKARKSQSTFNVPSSGPDKNNNNNSSSSSNNNNNNNNNDDGDLLISLYIHKN
jgi:hypothetical protein